MYLCVSITYFSAVLLVNFEIYVTVALTYNGFSEIDVSERYTVENRNGGPVKCISEPPVHHWGISPGPLQGARPWGGGTWGGLLRAWGVGGPPGTLPEVPPSSSRVAWKEGLGAVTTPAGKPVHGL